MSVSRLCLTLALLLAFVSATHAEEWVVYKPKEGDPRKSKHIVLVSGDEEYRSEEALPQLAQILTKHHGFTCTVLFAIDTKTGEINPNVTNNIPGLEALAKADLMVIFTRFRNLPDEQMKHIDDYLKSGKPVVGMRTSTHAFQMGKGGTYSRYSNSSREKGWEDGFGRVVLGEKWISHHGGHGSESTRGLIAKDATKHPIVNGLADGDVWGPTDVYGVRLPLPGDSKPIIMGQVLKGMKADSPPVVGKKNDPMMPVAWTKSYEIGGKKGRVFNTTMGASQDLLSEGTRRLLVNGCYWALDMEVPAKAKVDIVGDYKPLPFKFGGFKKGVKPADLAWK